MTGLLVALLAQPIAFINLYVKPSLEDAGIVKETVVVQEVVDKTGAVNEDVIVNGYFDYARRIGRIIYSPGCAGRYTKCKANGFDCSGLLRGWGRKLGILTDKQLGHTDSTVLYNMGTPKKFGDAKRGDFVLFLAKPGQLNASGEIEKVPNHIAVVSRHDEGGVWIFDAVPGPYAKERHLVKGCKGRVCGYMGKRSLLIATNGLLEEATRQGIALEKYSSDRATIDASIRRFLASKGKSELADSFFIYGKNAGIKPEMAVCIAVSESGLGKNVTYTGNIGNVGRREYASLDEGIWAIYYRSLNGRHLGAKRYVGDLYKNGDCKIQCRRRYASGLGAQRNVLKCLTRIYGQNVGPDFEYRY